jgi:hypothetical protein
MNIVANGQQYNDWASLPPEVKQQLAQTLPDLNHNGVPDLFEQAPGASGSSTFSSVMVNVNGQTYTSAAQMPPEMQEMLRQALGGLNGLIGSPAPPPGAALPPPAPMAPNQVLLNGVPTTVEAKPRKKRWWQRG